MTGIDKGNIPTITSSKKAEFVIKFEILNVFIFHRNNANKQPINNDSNTSAFMTGIIFESLTNQIIIIKKNNPYKSLLMFKHRNAINKVNGQIN